MCVFIGISVAHSYSSNGGVALLLGNLSDSNNDPVI